MIPKFHLLLFTASLCILTGCVNTKKLTYFNDIEKANGKAMDNKLLSLKVQPGDVLQITITTIDKDISMILNPVSVSGTSAASSSMIDQGYLVDSTGYVGLPMVGKVYVKGKTTSEINTLVALELDKTIRNAFVSTRIANFRVSVLGDVARPGSFKIPAERASILDALSMAGDLNNTAIRDDIMIIRETEGVKEYATLDLNDSKALSSPYYYLNNNDVVYVKPGKKKAFANSTIVPLLPTVISALSLITTLIIVTVK
ncbi:polysaccharide export outer membrane protein [Chitinophaga sp. YR573]|uniref:polysaccharide biosynthesis/export family protein n=1 Tax=Chitinophaga sp. YR573 TaxID=1881040 RepID=UPI0008D0F4EA|nr:polysaccharide biosynthesis/export family protein [Chitinophaga sp. YR573]SEV92730.1 polysaccharide export outer membrane protein [Chitinophaga sp. YR573]